MTPRASAEGVRGVHFVFVVIAATLWGAGGTVGKLLGDHSALDPNSVAMLRMGVGGLVLVAWLAVRGRLHLRALSREAWVRILWTGAFTALFEGTFFNAIKLSSVGFAALIAIGSTPVFVALYEWWRTKQLPKVRTLVALLIALVGLVVLLSGSLEGGRSAVLGAGLALVTGFAFAGITIVNRTEVPGLGAVALTGISFTAGAFMLLPLALMAGIGVPSDAVGWGLVVLLGVVVTAVAYVFFLVGLHTVPPGTATIITLLEPLVAAVLGALVFGESLGWRGAVGGAMLAAAVVLLRPQRDRTT